MDNSAAPSLFAGQFGKAIGDAFNRIRFGGTPSYSQKAYFINLQEIKGIRFGTRNPVNYFDNFYNSELLDGTTWTLDVTLEKKHALSYRGCNGYPPYWNRLLSLLSPIFDETGINSTIFTV